VTARNSRPNTAFTGQVERDAPRQALPATGCLSCFHEAYRSDALRTAALRCCSLRGVDGLPKLPTIGAAASQPRGWSTLRRRSWSILRRRLTALLVPRCIREPADRKRLVARYPTGAKPANGVLGTTTLRQIRDYLMAHLDEPIDVATLVRMCGRAARSASVPISSVRLRVRRAVNWCAMANWRWPRSQPPPAPPIRVI
jgi:hypothetical protein